MKTIASGLFKAIVFATLLVTSRANAAGAAAVSAAPKGGVDPNAAIEIRGQARNLSMMLVLKNGKDSINFIKVRKDYRPEIARTEY